MLALVLNAAFAAPLSPVLPAGEGPTVQVAAAGGSEKRRYADPYCNGPDCVAVQAVTGAGIELEARFLPFLGGWLSARRYTDRTSAALLIGSGYGASIGLQGEFSLGEGTRGLQLWAGADVGQSTDSDTPEDQLTHLDLELGVAGRVGDPRDGGTAWLGVNVVPWSASAAERGSDFVLDLVPALPGSVVLGGSLTSRPLDSVWSERGRAECGVAGTIGYQTGARVWVGFGW